MDTLYKRLIVFSGKTLEHGLFFTSTIASTGKDGLSQEDLDEAQEYVEQKLRGTQGIEEPNLVVVNVIKLL